MLAMTSCRLGGVNNLSERKAQKLYNTYVADNFLNVYTFDLNEGFYECNDSTHRNMLRELDANGIVSYRCERVVNPSDQSVAHFVTVKLTDKGRLYIEKEKMIQDLKDLEPRKPFWKKHPENKVDADEFANGFVEAEVKAELEKPYDPDMLENIFARLSKQEQVEEEASPVNSEYLYNVLRTMEWKDTVKLRGFVAKCVKVRNTITMPLDKTTALAMNELVLEVNNVTPVGRICMGVVEKGRFFTYRYYGYTRHLGWRMLYDGNPTNWENIFKEMLAQSINDRDAETQKRWDDNYTAAKSVFNNRVTALNNDPKYDKVPEFVKSEMEKFASSTNTQSNSAPSYEGFGQMPDMMIDTTASEETFNFDDTFDFEESMPSLLDEAIEIFVD